jgi:arylsulfatase A-like enzyme
MNTDEMIPRFWPAGQHDATWRGPPGLRRTYGCLHRWLTAALLLALSGVPLATAEEARPIVVLVMADDQGWGEMAYYGHPHLQTPQFDAFAREGVRFDRFYAAAPVCSPTRASVLTGRHPNRSAVFKHGRPLRPQEVTLAEVLAGEGYRTGHFGKWHLGSVRKGSPVNPGAQGFDAWVSSENYFDLDPILSDRGRAVPRTGDTSDITVDEALKFIREYSAGRQSFLAVIWFASPHGPMQAREQDRAPYAHLDLLKQQIDYFGEIAGMDRAFGRLRRELRELGLRENTLLWYCSDNGAPPVVGSTGGRRSHKGTIYEGGLAVPAILEWPARIKAPRVITAPAVTSDIYPTVVEYTGARVGRQPPLDGRSLRPLLEGTASGRNGGIGFWNHPVRGLGVPTTLMDELYAAQQHGREPDDPVRLHLDAGEIKQQLPLDHFPGHAAWLAGYWKLHRIEEEKTGAVAWELYDLASDPVEARNVIAQEPELTRTMQNALRDWQQSVARSQNGADYSR